jgi:branched-subunit amino acid aminotransferase/4-amino-4-deoxychorismate lyase
MQDSELKNSYFIFNGQTFTKDNNPILTSNRAFRYGDGLFETGRILNGKIPLIKKHIERILKYAQVLKLPNIASLNSDKIEDWANLCIQKNGIEQGGKLRITFFREGGNHYFSNQEATNILIETEATQTNQFDYNYKGLVVDMYADLRKPLNFLSNAKTNNALIYVMGGIFAKEKGLDNCILQNDQFNVAEALNSNIFLAVNGVLYTPPIEEACVDGVMRSYIKDMALSVGMKVYETTIKPNDLLRADELFLTNSFKGINWVGAYRSKRYFNTTSEKLNVLLNKKVLEEMEIQKNLI